MGKYFINFLLVMALFILGCSSNSDYINNGTFAVSAASIALTPGSGTIISAKYTTTADLILDGNRTSFTSNRPDLVNFNSTSVNSDGSGAASTGLTVITTAQIPVGGVDVVITATFRGLSSNVVIHINPGTGTRLSLTAPNSANTGTSFALTATLTPLITGKALTFSSDNPNLISFSTLTGVTDGSGSTVTVISVKSTVTIPTDGLDIALSVTDGTFSTAKVVHINQAAVNNSTITLTAPATATSGSSFTITTGVVPIVSGKSISYSSDHTDLISFVPSTVTTDGSSSAITAVSVNPAVIIPVGGIDVILSATDGTVATKKVMHITSAAMTNSALKLNIPALVDRGNSYAMTAVLSPVMSGDSVTFTSNHPVLSFIPASAITDGSGTAKSVVAVSSGTIPLNGLDVTVLATDGTVSDLQVVHVNGPEPASFSIFPASLDISNIVSSNTTKTIQIVATTPGSYNFSAASRAPFIIDVQSVNNSNGIITLAPASIVQSCSQYNNTSGLWNYLSAHNGTVLIEIKDNSPSNPGPTLYYPVTYSLCW